jgi:exosome complex component RRP41
MEEQELPFLTVATLGTDDKISVLMMETRVQLTRLEAMIAVGVDGCKQIRNTLDGIVRQHGNSLLQKTVT